MGKNKKKQGKSNNNGKFKRVNMHSKGSKAKDKCPGPSEEDSSRTNGMNSLCTNGGDSSSDVLQQNAVKSTMQTKDERKVGENDQDENQSIHDKSTNTDGSRNNGRSMKSNENVVNDESDTKGKTQSGIECDKTQEDNHTGINSNGRESSTEDKQSQSNNQVSQSDTECGRGMEEEKQCGNPSLTEAQNSKKITAKMSDSSEKMNTTDRENVGGMDDHDSSRQSTEDRTNQSEDSRKAEVDRQVKTPINENQSDDVKENGNKSTNESNGRSTKSNETYLLRDHVDTERKTQSGGRSPTDAQKFDKGTETDVNNEDINVGDCDRTRENQMGVNKNGTEPSTELTELEGNDCNGLSTGGDMNESDRDPIDNDQNPKNTTQSGDEGITVDGTNSSTDDNQSTLPSNPDTHAENMEPQLLCEGSNTIKEKHAAGYGVTDTEFPTEDMMEGEPNKDSVELNASGCKVIAVVNSTAESHCSERTQDPAIQASDIQNETENSINDHSDKTESRPLSTHSESHKELDGSGSTAFEHSQTDKEVQGRKDDIPIESTTRTEPSTTLLEEIVTSNPSTAEEAEQHDIRNEDRRNSFSMANNPSNEEEIERLQNEIQSKAAENATLLQRHMASENESKELSEKVSSYEKENAELKEELERMCNEKISSYHKEIEGLKSELQSKTVQLTQKETEAEARIIELQTQVSNSTEKLKSLEENISSHEEEIERLQNEIQSKLAENATLVQRWMASEDKSKQLSEIEEETRNSYQKLETRLTECQEKVSSCEKENADLKEELERIRTDYNEKQKLTEELSSLKESRDQEVNAGKEKDTQIEQLNEKLKGLENALAKLHQQLTEKTEEFEKLDIEMKKRNEDNATLLHKHLEEEKRAREFKDSSEQLKCTSQDLESQLKATKVQLTQKETEAEARIKELQTQVSNSTEKLKSLEAQSKQEKGKLQTEIYRLTKEAEGLRNQQQQAIVELKRKEEDKEKLNAQLHNIKRELEKTQRDKTQMDARINQLTDQLKICQTKILEFEAAITLKEAEKNYANECMQKAVQEHQSMIHQVANLQRMELEKRELEQDKQLHLNEITRLRSSLQESQYLRNHLQEYYKLLQDSQMELNREKEKNRHFNELLSTTGHRLENMAGDLHTYRSSSENNRRLLEHEKENVHGLQRQIDRLSMMNEKLQEERDKYHQESFDLKDQNQELNEEMERSRIENTELKQQIQNLTLPQQMAEDATDGTIENRRFPQGGNFNFTSTPSGRPNGNGPPVFGFGMGSTYPQS